jgi:plastocyanin
MNEKIFRSPDAEAGNAPAAPAPENNAVHLARWQALADFRSRASHLRQHRPSSRIRYALRDAVIAFACAAQLALQPACGGTITGTVHAEGKADADSGGAAGGAYASRKYSFVQTLDYSTLKDFIVYVDDLTLTNTVAPTNVTAVTTSKVAQKRAEFFPHVLPVLAGSTVEWPNNDEIFHNVFSMSEATPFDLGLYKGNPPEKRVAFDQPGKVDVFCSIHANMHCIVLVMANPYFAATDSEGRYRIENIPPGKYKLKAWHERLPAAVEEIVVPTNGEVKINFTLGIKNLPKI